MLFFNKIYNKMDYNEFEHTESPINENRTYSDEIEYVVEELNNIVHAGGRACRSTQLRVATRIVRKLSEMRKKDEKLNEWLDSYREKKSIYDRAKKIISSDLEWHEKYDMIFSDDISRKFSLDYYDPDLGYEEDVTAFIDALDEHMKKQDVISRQIYS